MSFNNSGRRGIEIEFHEGYTMKFSRLFLPGVFLCLAACGGGSGGGSNGRPFDPPADTAAPLDYNGVTARATLATTNTGHFAFDLLTDSLGNPQSIIADNNGNVAGAFQRYFEGNGPRESSIDCVQGSVDYYVDIEGDGTGTVHIDNKNCDNLNGEIDGLLILKILEVDPIHATEHATMKFNRLIASGEGFNTINSGSVEFEEFAGNNRRRLTLNVVMEETNSGRRFRLSDMVFDRRYEDYAGSDTYTESISGRLYDSEHGYVDVTTSRRIKYASGFSGPVGGELQFAGAGGSKALIEFSGGLIAVVHLDADGDDIYEINAAINLAGNVQNDDIGDDDGDGMHNSWEIFYGLNPQNGDDADLDGDGDSVSNRGEYLTGTLPGNGNSARPFIDLRLGVGQGPFPAGLESSLRVGASVDSNNTGQGNVVKIRVVMPQEFILQSASEECDIEGNIVVCVLQDPYNFFSDGSTINFIAPEMGTYAYEATLYSNLTVDPDETNNVRNGLLEVGPATAELSAAFIGTTGSVPTIYEMEYSFEIENAGIMTATDVRAELEFPEGITHNRAWPNNGCALSGRIMNCSFGDLSPGGTIRIGVPVSPPASPGLITATLTVSSDIPELSMADNIAEQTNEIIATVSDMYLDFSPITSSLVGEPWEIYIVSFGGGPHYPSEAQVTIDLPPEVELISSDVLHSFEVDECTGADPLVCTIPHSHSGFYRTILLTLNSSVLGIHEFPVTLSSIGDDPDLSDNTVMVSAFIGQSVTSIQAQIDAAAPGATIEVPAGYYRGDLEYNKHINLVGIDGAANTFWSVPDAIYVGGASSGEIAGFTFTHGITAPLELSSSTLNVHDNIFENIRGAYYALASAIVGNYSNLTIESNIMRNLSCNNIFDDGVLSLGGSSGSALIRNNLFLNNDCTALNSYAASIAVNNGFIANAVGLKISDFAIGSGGYVGNNIFQDNGVGIETDSECGIDCPSLRSNLFHNNGQNFLNSSDQVGINGNISADPLFTDAANGDYTLQPGSPAIDAGDVLNAPADDFNGNPRPVDGDGSATAEPDIGAYEFQSPD